ncbi:unnamed protein product [Brachionus calyciflorus]|uniref:Uncharacterized protein n=1 Tax=Brachionus calyciflorus TaxID=104777 RepID=A0A814DWA1_9BILA|nr:unnamed protein product [Brachionus calyciflorus]
MSDQINYEDYIEILDSTLKYILNFNNQMKNLIKRLKKLRDSGDDMVKSLNEFTNKTNLNTEINSEFCQKYQNFSKCLSIVEDNRDTQIDRLEAKLTKCFENLLESLKLTKTKYKPLLQMYEKEISRNRRGSILVQNGKYICDFSELKEQMSNLIRNFEQEKIKTFNDIFKEYTLIQLSFCSNATRVYTNAYNCLSTNNKPTELNITEMTKSLYQHNFESALIDSTNKQNQTIPKFPFPNQSPKLTSTNTIITSNSIYENNCNITNDLSLNRFISSNSLFGTIKLNNYDDEDFFGDDKDTTEISSEDETYESKKEKVRQDFLKSLDETEL